MGDLDSNLQLTQLRVEHRDLDEVIDFLIDAGFPDQTKIQRLKKRKLLLRDQIAKIEREVATQ